MPERYRDVEVILDMMRGTDQSAFRELADSMIAKAQVHATLALAACLGLSLSLLMQTSKPGGSWLGHRSRQARVSTPGARSIPAGRFGRAKKMAATMAAANGIKTLPSVLCTLAGSCDRR